MTKSFSFAVKSFLFLGSLPRCHPRAYCKQRDSRLETARHPSSKHSTPEHCRASTSYQHIPTRTPEPSPAASSSGSLLGSPDRHGSPPYTVLRKSSQSSRSSRFSQRDSESKEFSPSSSRPRSETEASVKHTPEEQPSTVSEAEKPEEAEPTTADASNMSPKTDRPTSGTDDERMIGK
ncbi:hypothetical protein COOONC_20139, partial [Cooperia oncophora]